MAGLVAAGCPGAVCGASQPRLDTLGEKNHQGLLRQQGHCQPHSASPKHAVLGSSSTALPHRSCARRDTAAPLQVVPLVLGTVPLARSPQRFPLAHVYRRPYNNTQSRQTLLKTRPPCSACSLPRGCCSPAPASLAGKNEGKRSGCSRSPPGGVLSSFRRLLLQEGRARPLPAPSVCLPSGAAAPSRAPSNINSPSELWLARAGRSTQHHGAQHPPHLAPPAGPGGSVPGNPRAAPGAQHPSRPGAHP